MRTAQALLSLAGVLAGQASAQWAWGNDCASLSDQYCADSDCGSCRWSWPAAESWDSPDAACRCAAVNNEWTFGGDCASLTDQHCGDVGDCSSCRWSWPAHSDWNDRNAACRCAARDSADGGDSDDEPAPAPSPSPSPTPSGRFPSLDVEVDGQKETLYV